MKKILYLLAVLSCLAACSKNGEAPLLTDRVTVDPVITRATETNFEDNDRIGLRIVKEDGSLYADNARLVFSGGIFSGDLEWYAEDDEKSTFNAYYPYSEAGMPSSFTVESDQRDNGYGASDLMGAVRSDLTPTGNSVGMVFKHMLTRILINVENHSGNSVDAVVLKGSLPTAGIDWDELTVEAQGSPVDITAGPVEADKTYQAIVVPQTVEFAVSVTTSDGNTLEVPMLSTTLIQSGQYRMKVHVFSDRLEVTISGEIENWSDEGRIGNPIIKFETKSGSEVDELEVIVGGKIPEPAEPTLAGYDFGGWFTESEYETQWDFENDTVEDHMTLYAYWIPGNVKEFYMAPDGDDYNPGTIDAPLARLNKALDIVQPGQTIWIRGGTYYMTNDDITRTDNTWSYVFDISTAGGRVSGTAGEPINIWGYEGERPVLDMSQVRPDPVRRVIVFYVDRSYYHFKNFEIVGTQVVVTGHTQSECFRNDGGNYNIYENLSMHDGMAIGFYLTRGTNNLVLNCDAYNNYDNFSEGAYGGNVDGFGAHVPNANHVGNVFRGCRAWWNSDDGFDLINCFAPVIFENCWSFYNGYQPGTMDNAGDGSGFKAGGYGLSGVVNIDVVPMHTVRGCLAYYNLNQGFYSNHHLGGIEFYNNTAMANPSNFNMLNRDAPENVYDRPEGYGHIVKNNVSYQPRRTGQHLINVDFDECEVSSNSFYPVEMNLTDADFVSLDPAELTAPRKADGSLPDINFLRPAAGSQLIGAGEYLGFDYTGTTLGCYQ